MEHFKRKQYILLILVMLSMVSKAQSFSGEDCVVVGRSLNEENRVQIVLECSKLSVEKGENIVNDSFLTNAELACPTDPKTCAYYYCRHSWPPVGCI